jgi:hypothetical protein
MAPDFVIDAHTTRTMRSVFFNEGILSVSNDCTFALWDKSGQLHKRVAIEAKPNWIETANHNTIYISDVTTKLSIYTLK